MDESEHDEMPPDPSPNIMLIERFEITGEDEYGSFTHVGAPAILTILPIKQ